ncbi:conserved hypothetical protein [Vibrio crassostreae]|nr:conserved hypothetical protein [Vibrio crassostreae]CAK1948325.1 conserved hypothetical protein [Vibrio crassostreae]CAK2014544.1 conserved hypothetical protein [Vibrio crassostreae]CAK2329173.1 conserved hypothetical protein [Vibrio crassostreae]CAK2329678.1 conserved hypothetical protein [Vibrio crassostreae]
MNLGNMTVLNPTLAVPTDDKTILEDFVRGLIHSPYFIQLVLSLSRDDKVNSVNLGGLIDEMTMFECSGFIRFIELSHFYTVEQIFSPELMSLLRLKR